MTDAPLSTMMEATTPQGDPQSPGIQELMRRDHERMEQVFDELIEALRADAREDAERLWAQFESGLREHFDLEEKDIFPEFAQVDAREASALASEHEAIRRELTELGIGVDLHATRHEAVEAFRKRLRAHAEREDSLMYRWAVKGLPEPTRRGAFSRLAATARLLAKVM